MVIKTTGPISLLDIQNEFGGSAPIGLNEYYGAAAGIPSSGTIGLNSFYGASSAVVYDIPVTVVADVFKADQAILKGSNNQVLSNVFSGPANRALVADSMWGAYAIWFAKESGGIYSMAPTTLPYGTPTNVSVVAGNTTIASSSAVYDNGNGSNYIHIPDIVRLLKPFAGQAVSVRISMPS